MPRPPAPVPATDPDPDLTRDIHELIDEVVGPDPAEVQRWVATPNPSLGGRAPADLIGRPEEEFVRNLLRAAKHGMFS